MHILIMENSKKLAQTLQRILNENGHQADFVCDGLNGLYYATHSSYDVIILDAVLSGMEGFEVAKHIRKQGVPSFIIMLTALNSIQDKVKGLDSGADDYMTKPFSPVELLARLRAFERRQHTMPFGSLDAYDLSFDLENHALTCENRSITLSNKEFALMRLLISSAGKPVSKATIVEKIWGEEPGAGDNNAEAYVLLLRKKLRYLNSKAHIQTIRRVGYCLTDKEKEPSPKTNS